jgi:hypothetical protein
VRHLLPSQPLLAENFGLDVKKPCRAEREARQLRTNKGCCCDAGCVATATTTISDQQIKRMDHSETTAKNGLIKVGVLKQQHSRRQ